MSTPRNSDSGWGIMDGQSCYWDTNEENGTTNIFPDGMPRNRHDHEHIVVATTTLSTGETRMELS